MPMRCGDASETLKEKLMFIIKVRDTGRKIAYVNTKEDAERCVKDCEERDRYDDDYKEGYYQIVEYKC